MSSFPNPITPQSAGQLAPATEKQAPAGLAIFVRTGWLIYLLLILTYMFAGLPLVLAQNQTACVGTGCLDWQLPAEGYQRLGQSGISLAQYGWYSTILPLIVPLLSLILVTLVLWRRPTDRMTWLFALALGTCPVNLSMSTIALANIYPVLQFPAQLIEFCFASLFVFIFLFPDGRFTPRWTGWLMIPTVLTFGIPIFFPTTGAPGTITASIFGIWQALTAILMLAILIYRYRWVADLKQRQQIKLLAFGLIMPSLISASTSILSSIANIDLQPGTIGFLIQRTLIMAGIAFFIICLWVAVYRYQMFAIDLIINRTLVYSTLTAMVIGLYVFMVSVLGSLLQARESFLVSLVATGLIAVIFQPLRAWLQRRINRLLYGQRDEPYQVLTKLGSQLAAVQATEAILPAIVEAVRDTLHLPFVAIHLDQKPGRDETSLSLGTAIGSTTTIPLLYQGNRVGELIVSSRSGEFQISPADSSLLNDFARQAGIAVHAVQLATDLQRSREEIVTAREEERVRLRRDLHDGLGPSLATISLQSETARGLLRTHPEEAEVLLDELTTQAQTTMQEVRRLIHALRPPVLDDLGLMPGLNALAASFSSSGVLISIQSVSNLPEMPAAYEVAIYRIVQEALTNVIKHAQARSCTVRLVWDETICLEIQDDGIGIPQNRTSGVGLYSMRERAEELGGTCIVAANADRGTLVQVSLPVRSISGAY
jgi:signal transduction histidine kinase